MNPVFEITPESIIPEQTNLVWEITEKGFMYFFQREEDKMILGLNAFYFKQNTEDDLPRGLRRIFAQQPVLNKNFHKICISYSMPQSILIPAEFYDPETNETMLNLMHGDINSGIIFTDKINDKSIYNIYRIPSSVHHAISAQFPLASFSHQYSVLLKSLQAAINALRVIFYREKFVALLIKEGKLQIIQTYTYKTSEDVIYHLLNICQQFKVSDVNVQLSGMIENDSLLSNEIHKYFLNILFDEWSDKLNYTISIKELPPHFFSHQFSIAACG